MLSAFSHFITIIPLQMALMLLPRAYSSSLQFNTKLFNFFGEAYLTYLDTFSEYNRTWKNLPELDSTLRSKFGKIFDGYLMQGLEKNSSRSFQIPLMTIQS